MQCSKCNNQLKEGARFCNKCGNKVLNEPVKIGEEPGTTIEEPVTTIEEPVKEIEEPVKEIEEPVKEIEEPVKEIEEPVIPMEAPITIEVPIEPTNTQTLQEDIINSDEVEADDNSDQINDFGNSDFQPIVSKYEKEILSNVQPVNVTVNTFKIKKKWIFGTLIAMVSILLLVFGIKFILGLNFDKSEVINTNQNKMVLTESGTNNKDQVNIVESKLPVFNKRTYYLTGTIDGSPVQLQYTSVSSIENCEENGYAYEGFYYYDKYGPNEKVFIKGSQCGKKISFDEYYNGEKVGHFDGVKSNSIRGTLNSEGSYYECVFK